MNNDIIFHIQWKEKYLVVVGSWTCDLCAYLSSLLPTSGKAPGKGGLAVVEEYWVVVGSWTCDLCAYLSSLLLTSGGASGKGGLAVEGGVLGRGGVLEL